MATYRVAVGMLLLGLMCVGQGCGPQMILNEKVIVGLNRVAIADLQGQYGSDTSHFLVADLLPSGLTILDRSAIDALVNENRLTSSEIADQATAVKVGRMLGAQAVIFGHIKEVQAIGVTKVRVTGDVRMVDVERGSVAAALNATHVHDAAPLYGLECILVTPIEVLRAVFSPQEESLYKKLEDSRKTKAKEEMTLAVKGFSHEVGCAFSDALKKFCERERLGTEWLGRLERAYEAENIGDAKRALTEVQRFLPDYENLNLLEREVDALGTVLRIDKAIASSDRSGAEQGLRELRHTMPEHERLKDLERRVREMSLQTETEEESKSEKVVEREVIVK